MKKLLSIIMVLVLSLSCFSLTSCDKDEFTAEQLEAYQNYTDALEKTNGLNSLEGKLDMVIKMNVQGTVQSIKYKFNMKANGLKKPDTMKMRLDGSMDLAGQTTVMDCYLVDGWSYYDMKVSGQELKFKTNLNGTTGNSYSEMFSTGTVDLPKSLFKKVTVTEQADGSKLLELTLNGKQILSIFTDLTSNLGSELSASDISDATMSAVVNKDGYLSKVIVSYGMKVQGVSAETSLTVEYFNLGNEIAVEPIEGCESFPEQNIGI